MHSTAARDSLRPAAYGRALIDMLDGATLFSDFAWGELETLSRFVMAFEADPGHLLFREGEPGDRLYILVSGQVEAYKQDAAAPRTVIATEGAGKSIGEMALIDGEPRSASCVVRQPSVLAVISRDSFDKLSRAHPAIALRVMSRIARLISRRLRSTSGRLVDYMQG